MIAKYWWEDRRWCGDKGGTGSENVASQIQTCAFKCHGSIHYSLSAIQKVMAPIKPMYVWWMWFWCKKKTMQLELKSVFESVWHTNLLKNCTQLHLPNGLIYSRLIKPYGEYHWELSKNYLRLFSFSTVTALTWNIIHRCVVNTKVSIWEIMTEGSI